MAKGWKIALCIIGGVMLLNILMLVQGMRMMKWKLHEPMSPEQQESFSIKARIPSTSGVWERYAVKGMRDPEYMLESTLYKNVDEMIKVLPEFASNIEQAFENSCLETKDIKGNRVRRYTVKGIKQASEDEIGAERYPYDCIINYHIIEYEDGSLRFVADIFVT